MSGSGLEDVGDARFGRRERFEVLADGSRRVVSASESLGERTATDRSR
jgi:hypothetical protein